jgi:hypothetical protein
VIGTGHHVVLDQDDEYRIGEWRLWIDPTGSATVARTAGVGVRRDKAALSSGCKAHPAIRSSRKQSEQSWR